MIYLAFVAAICAAFVIAERVCRFSPLDRFLTRILPDADYSRIHDDLADAQRHRDEA